MRASMEWLKEFVNVSLTAEELSDKLTMAGLEVEGVEEIAGDAVLEVNVTPNRADCLSIIGIARDLSAVLDVPLKMPEFELREAAPADFRIEIADKDLCSRYAGRIIKGVRIGESPEFIKKRLEKCGIRSINNVVDITNYVLLELGHPLHAFDLGTLRGGLIRVARAGSGTRIITLDAVQRRLQNGSLLIWDAERPVAIAGVMGGAETEVTESTKDIFLESAWFNPASIRKTSKSLGLKSESSYRFERGADIEMVETALDRAAYLIAKHAGGAVSGKIDVYPEKFMPSAISITVEKINKTLGTSLPPEEVADILKRVGLGVKVNGEGMSVTPPSYRLDVKIEADIVEEIARLYGYDKIRSVVPKAAIAPPSIKPRAKAIASVKGSMRKEGFHEAVNFSFMDEAHLDLLDIPADDERRKAVRLRNPLRKEDSLLRTMLAPSLVQDFLYNFHRGIKEIRLFELSKVFKDVGEDLPIETLHAGAVFYKEKAPELWAEKAEGYYIIKGLVESIFDGLRIAEFAFLPSKEPFLHPGKSADIHLDGERIGFVGMLSPLIVERLDIKSKPDVLLLELDTEKILRRIPGAVVYRPIPKYPYVERDISILLDAGITASSVVGLIRAYPAEFVEEVSIFDSYSGPNIPAGKKSLAFAVRYRAKDRTLTDEEVEELHSKLLSHIVEKTRGEVRK